MAVTAQFQVICPACGYEGYFDLDELLGDPRCAECDESVAIPVRIEGFKRRTKMQGSGD